MKTLKKTLCLVLAMVMVFGLCVTSASAKLDAYEDKDTINYAEAVDVMTGIGVLAGDARGFRPGDDITRAEAAKIIAYIMIGDSDRADALKATSDPFPDVPASHWAAGYISYCATADIIAGMGDGYHPNDNVTGLQFAKMLLKALGYGVNDEYIGTDWAINVSRDALRLKIFEKNIAGANNNKANREECALYAFNAITKVGKVSYSALLGGYITSSPFSGTNDSPDANMEETFAQDFLLEAEQHEIDAFGRDTGHHWILTTPKRPIISADYDANEFLKANADDSIWATFTSEVTGGDIYKALGSDVSKKTTSLELYVNGIQSGVGYDDEEAYVYADGEVTGNLDKEGTVPADEVGKHIVLENFKKSNDKVLLGTGNGVQTFVYGKYVDGTLRVKICLVDTYLAQVTRVDAASGNKEAEATVRLVKKVSPDDPYPANVYTFETDEFEKDDFVLVTIADKDGDDDDHEGTLGNLDKISETGDMAGEVQTMIPAITKVSEISKFSKRGDDVSVVADDTTYVAAKNCAGDYGEEVTGAEIDDAAGLTSRIVNGEDHTLFLDEFGYLIATSSVVARTNYVYVAQFGIKISTAPSLTDKFNLMADVYYDDGNHEIVTVDTKKGIFEDTPLTTTHINDIANEYGEEFDRAPFVDEGDEYFEIGLYSMTTKDGKVTLSKVTSKDEYTKYYCMAIDATDDDDNVLHKSDDVNASPSALTATKHDVYLTNNKLNSDDAGIASESGAQAYRQYVTKGQARIDANKAANRANDKTVFFYVNGKYGDDDHVTVYTGINSVPSTKIKDYDDARLSEYAVSKKVNNVGAKAVQAAVVKTEVEGEGGKIIYFYGGSFDEANYDKLSSKVVRYKVYGGDQIDYLEIEYDSYDAASDAIDSLEEPGFVKVKPNGKLDYIVDDATIRDDKDDLFDTSAMTAHNPFYYATKDGDYYVNLAQVAGYDGVAGIYNHTVTASTLIAGDSVADAIADLLMPAYALVDNDTAVVDLRDKDEISEGGGRIRSIDQLYALFRIIADNHDGKIESGAFVPDLDNNTKSVTIEGLRVAISYTGGDGDDRTNVIKAIYILDNVDCTTDYTTDPEFVHDWRVKIGAAQNVMIAEQTP